MAVHVRLYLDDRAAASLLRLMAIHDCTATVAVELLLEHELTPCRPAPGIDAAATANLSPSAAVA
jgi:hypothetical protein